MNQQQLHILQHSLGLDQYGQGTWYRNHYVCGPGQGGYLDCCALVLAGLMQEHPPSELTGGDSCFVVTSEGKEAVRTHSPKPPRVTRAQKRYREWLGADCGLTFKQWLQRL